MLYPMFALVLITYLILGVNLYWRVQSVRKKQTSIKYFKLLEGGDAPEHVRAGTRHFTNLFELPVLFYAAGITTMVLQLETPFMQGLAWTFVVARAAHAVIHMGHNNVLHRMIAFWLGAMVVLAMWVTLVLQATNH